MATGQTSSQRNYYFQFVIAQSQELFILTFYLRWDVLSANQPATPRQLRPCIATTSANWHVAASAIRMHPNMCVCGVAAAVSMVKPLANNNGARSHINSADAYFSQIVKMYN